MVATYFPPAAGVGTFRVVKFVKYLPFFGWEPVVLTMDSAQHQAEGWPTDQSLLKDLPPDLRIYRTGGLRRHFLHDTGLRWLPYLVRALRRVLVAEGPDVVFLTGDPFFPLLAAPVVQTLRAFKYVIDLRDPWSLAEGKASGLKGRVAKMLSNVLEPQVLKRAERVLCVSSPMGEAYRKRYPQYGAAHFQVLSNGFDPDDYETVAGTPNSKFTMVYAGKFKTGEGYRNPAETFKALCILRERSIPVQLMHVGAPEPDVVHLAAEMGLLNDSVFFAGFKSYRDAISLSKGADLLLLIGGGQKSEQTGKVFDYYACKRPILGIVSGGSEVESILRTIPSARVVPNDAAQIARTIEHFIRNPRPISNGSSNHLDQYHRKHLTKQLAGILDDVTPHRVCPR